MRADYLVTYADLYQHGLKTADREGRVVQERGLSVPEHGDMCRPLDARAPARLPYKHGMVLNAWFDRDSGQDDDLHAGSRRSRK